MIQEAVDLIMQRAVDPGMRDFNLNTVYCRDTSISQLLNLAQTLPFMSEKRLLIVKEIDLLKADDIEELLPYLHDPSPSTCLVMISHQARYDNKKVISAVETQGMVTRFFPLLDREILTWMEEWARTRNLTLQRDAALYLWQAVGNDLQKIKNELDKVGIFIHDKKAITLGDVKAVVGDFREYTSFAFAEALGKKDQERAFLILSRLMQEGEHPVGLLGLVAWNFRRLMQAKELERSGSTFEEIKRKLNVIFHQAFSFQEQIKRYSMDELQNVFEILLKTDEELKSSGLNNKLIMERMILKICRT